MIVTSGKLIYCIPTIVINIMEYISYILKLPHCPVSRSLNEEFEGSVVPSGNRIHVLLQGSFEVTPLSNQYLEKIKKIHVK